MPHAADSYEILYQNLIDAGYNEETAKNCLFLAQNDNWSKLCKELAKQRDILLGILHESEKQIDCLDFLVYEINKKHKNIFNRR